MYSPTKHPASALGFCSAMEPTKTIKAVEKGVEVDEFGPINSRTTRPGEKVDIEIGEPHWADALRNCFPHEACGWDRLDHWQLMEACANGPTPAQLQIIHDWGLDYRQAVKIDMTKVRGREHNLVVYDEFRTDDGWLVARQDKHGK
jgi:hypothetical protein